MDLGALGDERERLLPGLLRRVDDDCLDVACGQSGSDSGKRPSAKAIDSSYEGDVS